MGVYGNLTKETTEKMPHAFHWHFSLIDVTDIRVIGQACFSRDGWILAEYSFAYLMRKKNKQTRELCQYLDILTEQAWSKKDFLCSKKITLYWVRVKNYFFTSRAAGRKSNLFVAHETHESSLCFLCFDCILPLFATPSPTLSKNYKLGRSAPRNFLQSPSCLLSDFSWQG